jgi:stage II sporulation protein AB (anti-sigma F factor)
MTALETIEFDLPAVPESVSQARAAAAGLAVTFGMDGGTVALCVSEALSNAVVHGYPGGAAGTVRLRAWAAGGAFFVEVADDGIGMPIGCGGPESGMGMAIIASLVAGLEISHGDPGTTVRMTFVP